MAAAHMKRTAWRALGAALLVGLPVLWGCQSLDDPSPRPERPEAPEEEIEPSLDGMTQQDIQSMVETTPCDTDAFRDMADAFVTTFHPAYDPEQAAAATPGQVLVSAEELNNSQMHDCQRLVEDQAYGPLVALFVDSLNVVAGNFQDGVVVADIVSYGNATYQTLGIERGISCLWLQAQDAAQTQWIGAIRTPDGGDCASAVFDTVPGNRLEVHAIPIDDGSTDFVHTGRWMWDHERANQFIGIRCGDRWCEIGATGFSGTTSIATANDVPGRFDEQYLAYIPPTGELQLSSLWGRIEPGADNGRAEGRLPPDPGAGPWHVATMTFDGPDDTPAWHAYVTKFALTPDHGMAGHRVFLGRNPAGPPGYRVKSANGPWTGVARCKASHSGTGTVRWAWSEDDEGFWVPCDEGCCRTTGMQGGS